MVSLHLRQPHGPARVKVFPERLPSTGRHVADDFFFELGGRSLECGNQGVSGHLFEHGLYGTVVEFEQVIKDKHLVHDFLGQLGVINTDGLNHRAFQRGTQLVDHFCGGLDTTERIFAGALGAGQGLEQHLIEVFQCRRLYAFHGGNTQHHLIALAFTEKFQDGRSLVKINMDQNSRHDLWMFVAQQLGHCRGIHPLQALDARGIVAAQDPIEQQGRFVITQRPLEH